MLSIQSVYEKNTVHRAAAVVSGARMREGVFIRWAIISGAVLCIIFSALPIGAQTRMYTVTEVTSTSDADFVGRGLNSSGHITGRTGSSLGPGTRAFLWTGKSTLDEVGNLDVSAYSSAFGINDADQIVGAVNSTGSIQAFVATANPRRSQLLANLPGDNSSQALSINASGDIVGYSTGPNGQHACLWSKNGTVESLGVLAGGNSSKAFDVSDSGYVVGTSTTPNGPRAFVWTRQGGMQNIGTLPGDKWSEAFAVNNAGDVVGYSQSRNGVQHAFLWSAKRGMWDLGVLPGGKDSRALAISNTGDVVGTSSSPFGDRAFLWTEKDGIKDLNLLIPSTVGLRLVEAEAINARGQIVVIGTNASDGHDHEGPNRLLLLTLVGGPSPNQSGLSQ